MTPSPFFRHLKSIFRVWSSQTTRKTYSILSRGSVETNLMRSFTDESTRPLRMTSWRSFGICRISLVESYVFWCRTDWQSNWILKTESHHQEECRVSCNWTLLSFASRRRRSISNWLTELFRCGMIVWNSEGSNFYGENYWVSGSKNRRVDHANWSEGSADMVASNLLVDSRSKNAFSFFCIRMSGCLNG